MKKNNIPQDNGSINDLYYAVDEEGNYITATSTGWDPKKIALDNAVQEINERTAEARVRVLNGDTSPIEYYMELNRMDIGILSSYVGFWKWRVKRHFKPKHFTKMSLENLKKYADVFEVSVEKLKNIENGN